MTKLRKMLKFVIKPYEKVWYNRNENREVVQMIKYNKSLETLAHDILVKNDMLKLPVNLISIADKNGIDVYYSKLPEGVSGATRYNSSTKRFQIIVDSDDNPRRRRFTLAHEIAHFFLQREVLSTNEEIHYDVLYRKTYSEKEHEVDYLAGAILMEQDILKELYAINPSISELAKVFNVSESALTVRLMQLQIL